MIKVKVQHKPASEIIQLVKDMEQSGLVKGKDFTFAFYQTEWDSTTGEIPKHTIFTFYTEHHATMFALKYA